MSSGSLSDDRRRLAAASGVAAPILTLGALTLATAFAPAETFAWSERALSDMGRPDSGVFWLFNGGLVAGGLVGAPFVWRLWVAARNGVERAGVVAYGLALAGTIGVGVFFLEHTRYYLATELHVPAALSFFGMGPIAHWTWGTGAVLAGDREWGLVTLWIGNAHVITWLCWILFAALLAGESGSWFAVPEAIAAVCFGGWTVATARRLLARESATP